LVFQGGSDFDQLGEAGSGASVYPSGFGALGSTGRALSRRALNEIFSSIFESQYLVGAAPPRGRSISNVSSGRAVAPLIGAVRSRTRAKRGRREAVLGRAR
jgi:hypothetical protein